MSGKFILMLVLSIFLSFKSRNHYDSVYKSVPYFENKFGFKWNEWGSFKTTEDMNNRKINFVNLGFATKKPYTVDEIRVIFIEIVEQILNDINSDVQYKDAYDVFPLTIKNLNVSIMYLGYNLNEISPDKGYSATLGLNNIIYYRDRLSDDCPDQETYEEALSKVE